MTSLSAAGENARCSQRDAVTEGGDANDDNIGPLLYTPAQAAELLTVRESWLRRKAGQRRIPCTFLGRHLRFSRQDLDAIVAFGTRPAKRPRHRPQPRPR